MVGPGSYNHHVSYKKLHQEPCNASHKLHFQGKEGKGNCVFIGQNIMVDKDMARRFPGVIEKEIPENLQAQEDFNREGKINGHI